VATPAALVLLAAVPLVLVAGRRHLAAAVCRALAAVAVVLGLAGLGTERDRPAAGVCVVAAVDVSASVGVTAADAARAWLATLVPALGPADLVGSVAFAARPRVVAAPAPAPRPLTTLVPEVVLAEDEAADTDIAAAVATAAALCPGGRQAAVVLFTDGNETEGSVLAEAALVEPPVPVHAVAPPPGALAPLALRRLLVPALAAEHAPLPVAAVLESRAEALAAVALAVDGASLTPRPVTLAPGTTVVPLALDAEGPGPHALVVRLLMPPGAPAAPSVAGAILTVTGPRRVLFVSERAEPPAVARALAARGLEVEVVRPPGLAARAGRLDAYHALVLDDLGRGALDDGVLDAIRARVAGGAALIVTGGPHLFGDPGLAGTALEAMLPVTLAAQTPEPRDRDPIALYLLVDRSNSMAEVGPQGGAKMEYARRAALAVLEQLAPTDLVGAIAFDAEPFELAPLRPAAEGRAALAEKLRRLQHGGGTDWKEALEEAGQRLAAAAPRIRHVVLLTDGDTNRRADDHLPVIADLARSGVSVTTIRIGADAVNVELLATISRTTGGEFHHVLDVEALPQLMIRDAQQRMDASAGREDARARVGERGPMLAGIGENDLPPVARWAVTHPRAGAEVRLWVEAGDRREPLLATWQYELGRVAVIPLDFQGGSAGWVAWRDFGRLWTQLVAWAAPATLPADRWLTAERRRAGTVVRLDTAADATGPFRLVLPPPAGEATLQSSGRRRFTALVPELPPGRVAVTLEGPDGHAEPAVLVVPEAAASGRESRAAGPATAILAELAARTGGRVAPSAAEVVAARAGTAREIRPLGDVLAALALVALLADVFLRDPRRSLGSRTGARV
jgi:Mg-chelatase subunit ChlD